jgi:hypothetical protein
LFFSSLFAAPFYHEVVMAHCCVPSPGHHGPFNVAEMTPAMYVRIDAGQLRSRVADHLRYRRFGCAPIAAARGREVTALLEDVLTQPLEIHALAPANGSAPRQTRFTLTVVARTARVPRVRNIRYPAPRFMCLMFAFD